MTSMRCSEAFGRARAVLALLAVLIIVHATALGAAVRESRSA